MNSRPWRPLLAAAASVAIVAVVAAWWWGQSEQRGPAGTVVTAPRPSPPLQPGAGVSAEPGPDPEIAREAERQLRAVVPASHIRALARPVVQDSRQRIVCGEIMMAGPDNSTEAKHYVSFGGTGIAVVDDGSASFAEVYASNCGSGRPQR